MADTDAWLKFSNFFPDNSCHVVTMKIFPAIDIIDSKAVRLLKGDYSKMTVYNESPLLQAKEFEAKGAEYLHIVDLDAAKSGKVQNAEVIKSICENTNLFIEVGGGIRNMETAEQYLSYGVHRVILGTAAVTDESFLTEAAAVLGDKMAVGADVKDGKIAIKGWEEQSRYTLDEFCEKLCALGVKTVICTDISKDGAMAGTNLEMYRKLKEKYPINIVASGGVSSIEDIKQLKKIGADAAIVGKAYYTGAVDLEEAIEVAK